MGDSRKSLYKYDLSQLWCFHFKNDETKRWIDALLLNTMANRRRRRGSQRNSSTPNGFLPSITSRNSLAYVPRSFFCICNSILSFYPSDTLISPCQGKNLRTFRRPCPNKQIQCQAKPDQICIIRYLSPFFAEYEARARPI